MLEHLSEPRAGIVAVKAVGRVTRGDCEGVLEPLLDAARRQGRRVRLLCEIGPEFAGFTAGGAWEDAKVGLRSLRSFAACALVTDRKWIRESTQVARFFLPCPVAVFPSGRREDAIAWLRSIPLEAGVAHRLLYDKGVIVVEIKRPLTVEDLDAMVLESDSWIKEHGTLNGVVVHTRSFPGWANLESLVRQVQFGGDYLREVKRVAVATDGKLAGLTSRVGERFVHGEVRVFGYNDLDAAIAWVAESAAR